MGDFIEHSRISGFDSQQTIEASSRNFKRRTSILDKTKGMTIETPTMLPSV